MEAGGFTSGRAGVAMRGGAEGYQADTKPNIRLNGPVASEDESVGSKRRRHSSSHGQGNVPDSGRSVGSEGSASAQPKNKKRFVWPDDLHRDFVAAIFDVGLKSASPKTILEMMTNTRDLTADHIKSHLQKYRLHRERARDEFLGNFGRPNHNLSRDTPVVEEGGVDSDLSRGILQRGVLGGPGGAIAVDLRRGSSGNAAVAGGDDTTFHAQMSLIRECLQMQAGFQSVLKQALMSQQQLQNQLQAHLRALGLEASVVEDGAAAQPASAGGRGAAMGGGRAAVVGNHHNHQPAVAGRGGAASGMPNTAAAAWAPQQPQQQQAEHGAAVHVQDGQAPQHHHHNNHHRHHHHHDHQQAAEPAQPPTAQQQQAGGGGQHSVVTPNMQRRCAEQQMQEEMREHMDMHRQLVQRKNAQVSQYDDGSLIMGSGPGSILHPLHLHPPLPPQPSSSAAASHPPHHHHHPPPPPPAAMSGNVVVGGNSDLVDMDLTAFQWNDDDDQLFNFLMDPPA